MAELILFFTSRIGTYLLIGIASLLAILYAHHNGYKDGINEAETKYQKEYLIKLNKAIEELKTKQANEIKKAEEVANKEKEIANTYKNKSESLQKIINGSVSISKCGMTPKEYKAYKNILEAK